MPKKKPRKFIRPTESARIAALGKGGEGPEYKETNSDDFCAPDVKAGDDLDLDPDYPAQSFDEWKSEPERNAVSPKRRTLYIVEVGDGEFSDPTKTSFGCSYPPISAIADYVAAFYTGLPVRVLPRLPIVEWSDVTAEEEARAGTGVGKKRSRQKLSSSEGSSEVSAVGIRTPKSIVRVSCRESPDGMYSRQISLNDALDAVREALPRDAYAIFGLTGEDMYETADDLFVCGRAYGGSRIALISAARYHPTRPSPSSALLGWKESWPFATVAKHAAAIKAASEMAAASHLHHSASEGRETTMSSSSSFSSSNSSSSSSITSFSSSSSASSAPSTAAADTALWLSRICRCTVHELGHCFGLDHCVYYACCMQGSASLVEDVRQPPFLCPIDLKKVLFATGGEAIERYEALLKFCERADASSAHMFVGYAAFLRQRLAFLKGTPQKVAVAAGGGALLSGK